MNSTIHVIQYVLEHEQIDFFNNPDADHVFYHAMISMYGQEFANEQLQKAIKDSHDFSLRA